MISLDEYKKIQGKGMEQFSDDEIDILYNMETAFADFAFKLWKRQRPCKSNDEGDKI